VVQGGGRSSVNAVRTRLSAADQSTTSRRSLDERLLLRFPRLVVPLGAWTRLPPQSRLRRSLNSGPSETSCLPIKIRSSSATTHMSSSLETGSAGAFASGKSLGIAMSQENLELARSIYAAWQNARYRGWYRTWNHPKSNSPSAGADRPFRVDPGERHN
jgi:hypothetical protein